LHISLQWR